MERYLSNGELTDRTSSFTAILDHYPMWPELADNAGRTFTFAGKCDKKNPYLINKWTSVFTCGYSRVLARLCMQIITHS